MERPSPSMTAAISGLVAIAVAWNLILPLFVSAWEGTLFPSPGRSQGQALATSSVPSGRYRRVLAYEELSRLRPTGGGRPGREEGKGTIWSESAS